MTWVQLTEQEAKIHQGWKDGHTFGMHIFHLFALMKCLSIVGTIRGLGIMSGGVTFISLIAIALIVYSWRNKEPNSLLILLFTPVIAMFLCVGIFASQYMEDLLVSSIFTVGLWLVLGGLYALLSPAYKLNYKYRIKNKKQG